MTPRHVLLATLVAAMWGFNFVPISVALDDFPPLLMGALRFTAAAVPAVFLVRRPPVPARWLVLVGLPLGVGQFGLLFIGMHMGMPAGLASVVLQVQAIFTALFAALLLRERLGARQVAGMVVAFGGVALIGMAQSDGGGPAGAFLVCLAAAASWGLANIAMRRTNQAATGPVDAFGFMVWVSLVPPLPLFALSLLFEGPGAVPEAARNLSVAGVSSLAFIAYAATLGGFGAWGWLMRRYEASTVAMYSLLVPPFGLLSAVVLLGERVDAARLTGAVLVVAGVAAGTVRLRQRAAAPPTDLPPTDLPPTDLPPADVKLAETR
ncbi:EamA family transporter [Actinomadura livida]|uniref:EamA family transporter n=1 Tax=Actinomadura livida TaxID=79909 RepID=A0A7W7N1W5_9ACTN|nr:MULTISPECIES: EamA family transporter [Actinomadura]MBB4778357.1 O-acetylserine/cysteine efflux transporter [Actinomadura catellatispora]GGU25063.1 membrane protein [Actinomadura livida]